MGSLLTDPTPPEADAARMQREQRVAQIDVLVDLLLQGYREGDVSFKDMLIYAECVVASLSDESRRARLGYLVEGARLNEVAPTRRATKGLPHCLRDVILKVIEMVKKHERLGKTKDGVLWSRVAEIFSGFGIKLSARQVQRIYDGK